MSTNIQIPLLKDHHSHPLLYAAFRQAVSLQGVKTKETASEILQRAVSDSPTALSVVHGWRSNFFQWSPKEIEAMPPVAIFNVSLHSLLINSAAKQILLRHYGDVVNQLHDRTWYENNLRVVLNWFANLYASAENLRLFYGEMLRQGVYHVEEMLLVDENEINLFERSGMLDRTNFWAAPDTFESLSKSARDRVHGLKLFTDGAIGSRTAAIKRPFIGGSEKNLGMLIYSDDELARTMARCIQTGKSLAVHSIGDRAIEQVIESLEKSGSDLGRVPEIRIEHAQMITLELASRAKDLGVILCMQPNFSSDSVDYSDRLDAEYCRMNNPFRMLIDEFGFVAGEDLIFGSDGMPHGIEAAASQSFFPPFASQKLTIDEFVAAYCMEGTAEGSIQLAINEDLKKVTCTVM